MFFVLFYTASNQEHNAFFLLFGRTVLHHVIAD